MLSEPTDTIFAANRVRTRVALEVNCVDGRSRAARVREEGALRVRFPNRVGDALEAVTVNTAGGIAGGDEVDFELALGPGAEVSLTTAAAEKVYRSLGPPARLNVRLDLDAGARLFWLPQETIVFDQARLERAIDVELADGAHLLLAEAIVFGRAAMGEAVVSGRVLDRWRVRRSGRLVFADTLRLDGAISRKLSEAAVTRGGCAVATILVAPDGEAQLEALRAACDSLAGEAGVSSWNGICVVRLCAADSAVLRADMTVLFSALDMPLPRLWLS